MTTYRVECADLTSCAFPTREAAARWLERVEAFGQCRLPHRIVEVAPAAQEGVSS